MDGGINRVFKVCPPERHRAHSAQVVVVGKE